MDPGDPGSYLVFFSKNHGHLHHLKATPAVHLSPAEAAVVVWVLRDLSFSLVVFVLPEPLSRWFTSKGVTSVAGVPIQDGSEGSEGPSQRVFVGYESSDEL